MCNSYISDVSKGVYFFEVTTKENEKYQTKFIIQ
ncbi:T9SS type A sorting domain-containing protein [Flavobacterium sp.]